jgi:hypothetical protein
MTAAREPNHGGQMKKITGLNQKISPIVEEAAEQMPTYRRLYRMAVGGSLGKSGEEAIDLFQLGLKLRQEEDTITLEDAEFKLLKEAVSKNGGQQPFVAHIHGQMMIRLREDEARKD